MGQREAQAANSIPVDGDAARFFVKNAQRSSSQVIPNNSKDSENKAEMRSSAARSSSGVTETQTVFCGVLLLCRIYEWHLVLQAAVR